MSVVPAVLHAALLLALAADPAKPESPEHWVAQLGSPSWHDREAASARLLDLGQAALPALKGAIESQDPEVRSRARAILTRLTWAPPPGLSDSLASAWEHYDSLPESQRMMLLSRVTSELREKAKTMLQRVVRHDPSSKVRRQALGRLGMLDPGLAEAELRTLATDPAAADWAGAELGQLLANQGKVDEAIKVYEDARKAGPADERLLISLARLYEARQKWATARDIYAELARTQADGALRYAERLGLCHYKLGDKDKAEAAWREIVKGGGSSPEAYQMLAHAYDEVGAADKAVHALREGCQQHPQDFGLLLRLGQKLAEAGAPGEAIPILEQAQRVAPSQYQARSVNAELVRLLRDSGGLDAYRARQEAELQRLDAEIAGLLRTLAERHLAADDRAAARRTLEQLTRLYPATPQGRWAADRLKTLGN